jgi:hypothetical protein
LCKGWGVHDDVEVHLTELAKHDVVVHMGKVSKMIRQKYEVHIMRCTATRNLELKEGGGIA